MSDIGVEQVLARVEQALTEHPPRAVVPARRHDLRLRPHQPQRRRCREGRAGKRRRAGRDGDTKPMSCCSRTAPTIRCRLAVQACRHRAGKSARRAGFGSFRCASPVLVHRRPCIRIWWYRRCPFADEVATSPVCRTTGAASPTRCRWRSTAGGAQPGQGGAPPRPLSAIYGRRPLIAVSGGVATDLRARRCSSPPPHRDHRQP